MQESNQATFVPGQLALMALFLLGPFTQRSRRWVLAGLGDGDLRLFDLDGLVEFGVERTGSKKKPKYSAYIQFFPVAAGAAYRYWIGAYRTEAQAARAILACLPPDDKVVDTKVGLGALSAATLVKMFEEMAMHGHGKAPEEARETP